jgi:hypothetical protein
VDASAITLLDVLLALPSITKHVNVSVLKNVAKLVMSLIRVLAIAFHKYQHLPVFPRYAGLDGLGMLPNVSALPQPFAFLKFAQLVTLSILLSADAFRNFALLKSVHLASLGAQLCADALQAISV